MFKANSFEALKEILAPFPIFDKMIRDVPDPKKIDEFKINSGLKTLGNNNI